MALLNMFPCPFNVSEGFSVTVTNVQPVPLAFYRLIMQYPLRNA